MTWTDLGLATDECQSRLQSRWTEFLQRRKFADTLPSVVEGMRFSPGLTMKDRGVLLHLTPADLPSDWLELTRAQLVTSLASTGLRLAARALLAAHLKEKLVRFAYKQQEFFHDFARAATDNRWSGYGDYTSKVEKLDDVLEDKLVEIQREIAGLEKAHLAVDET